eukprot:68654-Chlamydomonas_euryale.AAC.7
MHMHPHTITHRELPQVVQVVKVAERRIARKRLPPAPARHKREAACLYGDTLPACAGKGARQKKGAKARPRMSSASSETNALAD